MNRRGGVLLTTFSLAGAGLAVLMLLKFAVLGGSGEEAYLRNAAEDLALLVTSVQAADGDVLIAYDNDLSDYTVSFDANAVTIRRHDADNAVLDTVVRRTYPNNLHVPLEPMVLGNPEALVIRKTGGRLSVGTT